MSARKASVVRTTEQVEVKVVFDLEGSGSGIVQTGAPFLDHLLALFARHGAFDLDVQTRFEEVRPHAVMEDVGACLGLALDKALGDRKGILRLGHCCAPVEDHLVRTVVEIAGHPCLVYRVRTQASPPGGPDPVEAEQFWHAFVVHARINLHIELLYGDGGLRVLEACFKAVSHALRDACRIQSRSRRLPNSDQIS